MRSTLSGFFQDADSQGVSGPRESYDRRRSIYNLRVHTKTYMSITIMVKLIMLVIMIMLMIRE